MYTIFSTGDTNPTNYLYNEWYDINCPRHAHELFEVLIVLSGTFLVEKGDKIYTLKENDAIIIMPYETHKFNTEGNSHIAVLELSSTLISNFEALFKGKRPQNPVINIAKDELLFIYRHINEIQNSPTIELNCIFFTLMSLVLKNTELVPYNEPNDIFTRAILYAYNHFDENISLADIANALNVSYVYLSRVFSKNSSVNFSDFINSFRVHKAVSLLKNTNENITDICYICGFGSIRNFNRFFSKTMNCTPNEFRKNYNELHSKTYGDFL